MQNAQTGQSSPLAIVLMGKHSKPSSRALALGAFVGGTFAIAGAALHLPAVLLVFMAIAVMLLCLRLTPSPRQ
jgi:hypothetical protein